MAGFSLHPNRKDFRSRAHSNPLSDSTFPYPVDPDNFDWHDHFPIKAAPENSDQRVEFADIGCGFGGLLVGLSPVFPDKLILGMEIREKVSDFVRERIIALRQESPGSYANISIVRTNAMKYLPNFFHKNQLSKIFFLFPDPHFKKSNIRRRIVSPSLLSEYAYVLRPGGLAYTVTDVDDLHQWMVQHFNEHPLFERVAKDALKDDPVVPLVMSSSEEAQKVQKNSGKKLLAVYRRIEGPRERQDPS